MRYPIVIHKDPDSGYGVTVPDLPGCFSAGDTMDEALQCAREAIECHVEGILIDGEDLPPCGLIEDHHENPDFAEGTWAVVDVDLSKLSGKPKRINMTIPERLLVKIDSFAKTRGETRSGFLAAAALDYMAAHSANEAEESRDLTAA